MNAVKSDTRAACCMLCVTITIVYEPLSSCMRSSIRVVAIGSTTYRVGVLLQCNFGSRHELTIAGVPMGEARIAAAATIGALNAALLAWADGDDPDLGSAILSATGVLSGDRR